jgi:hypothetical protein
MLFPEGSDRFGDLTFAVMFEEDFAMPRFSGFENKRMKSGT